MYVKRKYPWQIAESEVTPEALFRNRRRFIKAGIGGVVLGAAGGLLGGCQEDEAQILTSTAQAADTPDPRTDFYPVPRNDAFQVDRPITEEKWATTYNNFYEFGSSKTIHKQAQNISLDPWDIKISGNVEKEFTIGFEDLMKKVLLEERIYRHRCVEAWSMVVPWSGFPMRQLIDLSKPLSSAKYVRMETFFDPDVARGQKASWYPWPYTEGLTIEEASNDLAFMVTGLYGEPIPKQNGAPLRLAVPWKYGFKSIKSIVHFVFTEERPNTFWETIAPREYGFWANVNPAVPHPRWSQASERPLGSDTKIPTRLFNGYEEWVAPLYKGMEDENLYM